MTNAPLFSVVICSYQRYDRLPIAIESVRRQNIEAELFDIWIMDNSPPSDERAVSSTKYASCPQIHYIELDRPGLSNARNEAAYRSTAKYIVFLDDDAEAAPDWLRQYKEAFEKVGTDVGSIGGRIDPAFEVSRPPWLSDKLLPYLSICNEGPDLKEFSPDNGPIGANMAFDRALIVECGGFPTDLGRCGSGSLLSGEESDLCDRLKGRGKKLFYAPGPCVTHHIPKERMTRSWFRRRAAWQAISVQMKKPLSPEDALRMWPLIIEYLKKVPREHIAFMGLLWDTDDAKTFEHQMACIQFYNHILISQGAYPPEMQQRAG